MNALLLISAFKKLAVRESFPLYLLCDEFFGNER